MEVNLDKIIAELVKDISKSILGKANKISSHQYKKILVALELAFKSYLESSYARYSKIKTLLYRDRPVELRDHYVYSNVQIEECRISGADILNEFLKTKRNVVVGTAGSGKSVLLRRLFLDMVEKQVGIAPILVELRLLESYDNSISIQNYIHKSIVELDESFSSEQLKYALKQGKIMLLLDGFDEIYFGNRKIYEREILEISRKYPEAIILVSSRPDNCFDSWEEFHVYHALPLTSDQATDLVDRIDYDKTVKNKFIQELTSGLYERHKEFLSNPLLLTMMLLTYEQLAEIPEKIHIFYEQAFDTLFHKHDALKYTYKRKSYTGLPIDDFKRLFAAFCILTYSDRKISFSIAQLDKYINQAIKLESVEIDSEKFFKDLIESVCIIQKDGNEYTFTHRSFQEYFSAYFISRSHSIEFSSVLDSIVTGYFSDSVIRMLLELNREKVEMEWILPKLKELTLVCENAHASGNVIGFLSIFFDQISIHDGRLMYMFSATNHWGHFLAVLRRVYRVRLKMLFESNGLTDAKIKEQGKKDVTLFKQNFRANIRGVELSEFPKDTRWLEETSVPNYCKQLFQFTQLLRDELDSKYTTKGNSLKELLIKKPKSSIF